MIARGLMSVAITCSAWPARCRLCTPQPVPRSSARPTGRRMVSWASVAEAADTPSTKSGRIGFTTVSRLGVRSEATQKSPSSLAYGRMSIEARISRPWVARIPDSISGPTSPGSACSSSGRGTGCCSGHNRVSVASGIVPAGQRPDAGDRAVAPQCLVRLRSDRLDDCVDVIVRRRERRRQVTDGRVTQHFGQSAPMCAEPVEARPSTEPVLSLSKGSVHTIRRAQNGA